MRLMVMGLLVVDLVKQLIQSVNALSPLYFSERVVVPEVPQLRIGLLQRAHLGGAVLLPDLAVLIPMTSRRVV